MSDVSNSDAVDKMVATVVKRFGRLDVLVNNAGVHEGGEPGETSQTFSGATSKQDLGRSLKLRKVMATDVDGVFFGCRSALPHLEKTKGSIVNTASVSGTGAIGG